MLQESPCANFVGRHSKSMSENEQHKGSESETGSEVPESPKKCESQDCISEEKDKGGASESK